MQGCLVNSPIHNIILSLKVKIALRERQFLSNDPGVVYNCFVKIGFFDPYVDTLGGGEKYMLTAASLLSKKHTVSLFWDNPQVLQKAQEKFGFDTEKIHVEKNIFTPSHSSLQRILLTQDFDTIFYLSDGSIPLLGSKKLYVHFQFPVEWVKVSGLLSRFKIKRVTKFICNSEFTKSYIDKTFGIRSVVIYPPIDEFSSNTVEKKNVILSVGRFQKNSDGRWVKKQDMLIDTFQRLVDTGLKDWKLVLAGSYLSEDKKTVKELQQMIKGYPITIEENATLATLHKLYCEAKLYWHATGFGENLAEYPHRTEHFGITTVEAMQQGAVPIVINAGGQPEIVKEGENGMLWETQDQLMKKTSALIKNVSLYSHLQEGAKQTAKAFTTDVFAQHIQKLI